MIQVECAYLKREYEKLQENKMLNLHNWMKVTTTDFKMKGTHKVLHLILSEMQNVNDSWHTFFSLVLIFICHQ